MKYLCNFTSPQLIFPLLNLESYFIKLISVKVHISHHLEMRLTPKLQETFMPKRASHLLKLYIGYKNIDLQGETWRKPSEFLYKALLLHLQTGQN